jgi:hypothetical protein
MISASEATATPRKIAGKTRAAAEAAAERDERRLGPSTGPNASVPSAACAIPGPARGGGERGGDPDRRREQNHRRQSAGCWLCS